MGDHPRRCAEGTERLCPRHLRRGHHRSPVCFRWPDAVREEQIHRQEVFQYERKRAPPFDGDAKDQRSWTRWAAEWLYEARKASKPGAPVCMFIDWRQLPAATDAIQWAGWIWRGTAVWDKGNSRPQKGRFRQQAEYIVWGSNGDMPLNRPVPCLPGVFKYGNPQNRIHLTEKPLQLMRDIVKITEAGGRILDPFAGSGTTVLAAVLEGYSATGIEMSGVYAELAKERIKTELEKAA